MASEINTPNIPTKVTEISPNLILEVDSIAATDSDPGKYVGSNSPVSTVDDSQVFDEESQDVYTAETYFDDALDGEYASDLEVDNYPVKSRFLSNPDRPQKFTVKLLREWCSINNIHLDLTTIEPEDLDKLLCRFYSEIRSKNGQRYSRNTIMAIRYGLNRHFVSMNPPRELDIIDDKAFKNSNIVFKSVVRHAARENPEKTSPRISTEDLRKLYNSVAFSTSTPLSLLFKVWFEISIYFSRKRSRAQRDTKISDFVFDVDEDGRRFATEVAKSDIRPRFRMYEKLGDRMCPVASLEKLLTKVDPNCPYLFQRPRLVINDNWYYPERIGRNFTSQMMGKISKIAHLSHKYTNMSIKKITSWNIEEFVFQHRFLLGSADRPPMIDNETPSKLEGSGTLQTMTESGVSRALLPSQSKRELACSTDDHTGAFRPYSRKRTQSCSDKPGPDLIDVNTAKAKVKRIFQRLEYTDLVTLVDWLKRIDVLKDTSGTVFCRENCYPRIVDQPQTPRQFTPRQVQPPHSAPQPFILPSSMSVSNYLMNNVIKTNSNDPCPATIFFPPFSNTQSSLRLTNYESTQQTTSAQNVQGHSQVRMKKPLPIASRPSQLPSQEQLIAMRALQLGAQATYSSSVVNSFMTEASQGSTRPLPVTRRGEPTTGKVSDNVPVVSSAPCHPVERSQSDVTSASSSPNRLRISEVTGESKVWKIL